MPACLNLRCLLIVFVALGIVGRPAPALAGELDRVSHEARSSGSSSSSSSSSSSGPPRSSGSSSSSSSSDDSSGGDAIVLFGAVITSPWWVPKYALEGERPTVTSGFQPRPYVAGHNGQLTIDFGASTTKQWDNAEDTAAPSEPAVPRRNWALQLGGESGYVFDRVWREGLNLRFQTNFRIEFDAAWSLFMEREYGASDNLVTGREHIVWRFAQSDAVHFHTSLGAQHLIDKYGDVSGVDVAYGLDIYPGRPIILSFEGALGNLGSSFAPRVRTTFGFIRNRFELLLGYEHQWIGKETLGGPFAGLRVWL